jgi:hypothetical protein
MLTQLPYTTLTSSITAHTHTYHTQMLRKRTLVDFMQQGYLETYPQKINMTFQFLDSEGNGAFGVNDLALADDFLFSNIGTSAPPPTRAFS